MASRKRVLRVLSLFSGYGGLDLGLEGGFSVLSKSVNEKIYPDWIKERIDKNFVKLSNSRFETVFSNDILPCAQKSWNHFFGSRKKWLCLLLWLLTSSVNIDFTLKKRKYAFKKTWTYAGNT